MLLRFEVDACTKAAPEDDDELDSLTSAMKALATSEKSESKSVFGLTTLKSSSLALVPQADLIEMKTRVSHKALDWKEVYPQLYLSQTGYLYLARHTRGEFDPPEKYALGGAGLAAYAAQAEAGMWKLRELLRQIFVAVKKEKEGTGLCIVCEGGTLALYRRRVGTGKAVGNEIKALFSAA